MREMIQSFAQADYAKTEHIEAALGLPPHSLENEPYRNAFRMLLDSILAMTFAMQPPEAYVQKMCVQHARETLVADESPLLTEIHSLASAAITPEECQRYLPEIIKDPSVVCYGLEIKTQACDFVLVLPTIATPSGTYVTVTRHHFPPPPMAPPPQYHPPPYGNRERPMMAFDPGPLQHPSPQQLQHPQNPQPSQEHAQHLPFAPSHSPSFTSSASHTPSGSSVHGYFPPGYYVPSHSSPGYHVPAHSGNIVSPNNQGSVQLSYRRHRGSRSSRGTSAQPWHDRSRQPMASSATARFH